MTAAATTSICETCKSLKPSVYTDAIGRDYCEACFGTLPSSTASRMIGYLMATLPFGIGDRVQARTAGVLYDGDGIIKQISVDPANFGTPTHPSFYVAIDKPAYPGAPEGLWYMERQLRPVSEV